MVKKHVTARQEVRAQRKAERNEKLKGLFSNLGKHTWRLGVLTFVEVLVFVGVVSLIQADPVIKYTLATVIVVFTAREMY